MAYPNLPRRDLSIGPFQVVSILEGLTEPVGDELAVVGSAITAAERAARPFSISIPLYADHHEADPYSQGGKLRRQFRSLMENERMRLQGMYLDFRHDPELAGWFVIGSGNIEYGEGGLPFAEFKAMLESCYRVATRRRYREARRMEVYSTMAGTVARDVLSTIYSTKWAATTQAETYRLGPALGIEPVDVALQRALATNLGTYQSADGPITTLNFYAETDPHANVVSFRRRGPIIHQGRVAIYDRRNSASSDNPAAVVNYATNPSFEYSTTNWTTGGTNTITAVTDYSYAGEHCCRATYSNNTTLLDQALTLSTTTTYTVSVRVLIPPNWDGGVVKAVASNYGNAGEASANMGIRGSWQTLTFTVATGGDAVGNIQITTTGAPTVGRSVYVDALQVMTSAAHTSTYWDGDTRYAHWTGTAGLSSSRTQGNPDWDWGWDEVFGPDFPLTSGDVPVLDNGICRVVYDQSNISFRLDKYNHSAGTWTELGKVYPYYDGFGEFVALQDARVIETTAQEATVMAALATSAPDAKRAELYITLHQGWPGPRFELYIPDDGNGPYDAGIAFSPATDVTLGWFTGEEAYAEDPSRVVTPTLGDTSTTMDDTTTGDTNWVFVAVHGSTTGIAMASVTSPYVVEGFRGTTAYGSNRDAVGLSSDSYVSVHTWPCSAPVAMLEAESLTLGGTASTQTDSGASGAHAASAVQETQTAATANTVSTTISSDGGTTAIWARVRFTSYSGSTLNIRATIGASSVENAYTAADNNYFWVHVGDITHGTLSGATIAIRLWRTGGSGNLRIDKLALVPILRDDSTGAENLGATALYRMRSVPTYAGTQII